MLYPWQTEDWQRLGALRERLPHALLIHGQQGTGKRDLALHFAQGLLCESPRPDGQPCGQCAACHWFSQGNHPDFTVVRPEALETGGEGEADDSGKKKAPSKIIRMEQVRALIEAVGVGTHRAGLRVVVIYPLDALQVEGANALLKTLEEPPSSTVFLLVTDRWTGSCRPFFHAAASSPRNGRRRTRRWPGSRARAWPTPRRNWRWPAVPR